jgi:hypothetical protein
MEILKDAVHAAGAGYVIHRLACRSGSDPEKCPRCRETLRDLVDAYQRFDLSAAPLSIHGLAV